MREFKILIVEDEEVTAEILGQYATRVGPEIKFDWCWNGLEALACAEKVRPDLILMDYMMPKIDGLEVVQRIRREDFAKAAYIAVVSAYVNEKKQEEFKEAGADEVMLKPVSYEQLKEVIQRAKNKQKKAKKA